MYAPNQPGVYGLTNSRQWLYIGEADNIRSALLKQLEQGDSSILRQSPTGFVFEICQSGNRSSRQDQLIHEYAPLCNPESASRREDSRGRH
jgi:hypothetical protein